MRARAFFDQDDDEMIPFSLRDEVGSDKKSKKKKRGKYNSWTGDYDDEVGSDDEALGVSFAETAADVLGSGSMFVSGGALDEQLKKTDTKAKKEKSATAPSSGSKRSKKSAPAETKVSTEQFGVGAKLMQKLGWGGKGLGKNETGITKALEAHVRPQGAGLGSVREMSDAQREIERQRKGGAESEESAGGNDDDGDDENGDGARPDRSAGWKKLNVNKPKVQYKSAYDLLREEQEDEGGVKPIEIIDLTGPKEKVVLDPKKLYDRERATENYKVGVGRELRFNVDKLVDLAEVDLKVKNRKLTALQQRKTTFEEQHQQLSKTLQETEDVLKQLRSAEAMVARLVAAKADMESAAMESDEAAEALVAKLATAFSGALKKYGQSMYASLGMSELLYAVLQPVLANFFANNDFLKHPERGGDMAATLKRTLLSDSSNEAMQCWELFVQNIVVAELRTALTRNWDCKRQAVPAVVAVGQWGLLLGEEALHHLLHDIVWHKLRLAVDAWDPQTDDVPLHMWLHPWLNLLRERLQKELFPVIVSKLTIALAQWDARDASAFALLRPWAAVFLESQLEMLASVRILPKLTALVSSVARIVPAPGTRDQQSADDNLLDSVLQWHVCVPSALYIKFLARSVFPSLYRTAFDWIMSRLRRNQKPSEVFPIFIDWYRQLKTRFPDALLRVSKVSVLFAHLLDISLNLSEGRSQFEPEIMPFDLWADERRSVPTASSTATTKTESSAASSSNAKDMMSFRSMVEAYAAKHDVVFMPITSRTFNGKPLYSFGGIVVHFGNQVIYAEEDHGKWVPMSLEHLIDLCAVKRPADID